jgi:hypothetical protein
MVNHHLLEVGAMRSSDSGVPQWRSVSSTTGDATAVTKTINEFIDESHAHQNQQLAEYLERNKSWLSKILPNALDRALKDAQVQQAKTELQFQQRMLEIATNSKLAACRETMDAWVQSIAIGIRENFASFANERYIALERSIQEKRMSFNSDIVSRYSNLKDYENTPELYSAYKQSIDRSIANYYAWTEQSMEKFRTAVNERVEQYKT